LKRNSCGGKPLVDGADLILHNKRFLEAAKAAFGTSCVNPEFVAVNINGPMSACTTHVDNPSFYGATRIEYPLPILRVMGCSGLFEAWRVVRASTISWFYEGKGGNFDYWPEGLDGPMLSEQPPFGNVALCGDNDRMYHRIGPIGNGTEEMPRMSASGKIQPDHEGNWIILENGEVRATYPSHAIRFSVLWKAEVRNGNPGIDHLTLDRVMEIFTADLRHRNVDFQMPSDPFSDAAWILRFFCYSGFILTRPIPVASNRAVQRSSAYVRAISHALSSRVFVLPRVILGIACGNRVRHLNRYECGC
jgi:hypothetical protein